MSDQPRSPQEIAAEHLARDDPLGWFERVYASAGGDPARVPWARLRPNGSLVRWLDRTRPRGAGRRALVVGCGLGDDAAELARRGFAVTAFDLAPTAIAWCQRRFPRSPVDYQVADLLAPPAAWRGAFDFVFEAYTLQALPADVRPRAVEQVAAFVRPGGILLVVARGREEGEPASGVPNATGVALGCPSGPPWPLTRAELGRFEQLGLALVRFEDFFDPDEPTVRRFRAEYRG